MNKIQDLVRNFENHVSKVNYENPEFFQAVAEIAKTYGYPLSNAAVFNKNLLKLKELKYILVADNPGVTEQEEECYLELQKLLLQQIASYLQHHSKRQQEYLQKLQ